MPTRPPTICRHAGCPALVHDGSGYCALHAVDKGMVRARYDQGTRRNDPALAEASRIRSSADWQQTRNLFKARHPLCCDPLRLHINVPTPTREVHHIIGLSQRPDLAFDEGNLAPLCARCHARIEAMQSIGEDTRHLFAGKESLVHLRALQNAMSSK